MTFIKLNKILETRLKNKELADQLSAFSIFHLAEEFIKNQFGAELAKRIKLISFKSGILIVRIESAPLASEFKIYEKALIDFVNQHLKKPGSLIKIIILL